MRIALLSVNPNPVAPERLAFIAARERQRRGQRQAGSFPPALARLSPAEDFGGENVAIAVDHGASQSDVGAGGGAQVSQRERRLVQRFSSRTNAPHRPHREALENFGYPRRCDGVLCTQHSQPPCQYDLPGTAKWQ